MICLGCSFDLGDSSLWQTPGGAPLCGTCAYTTKGATRASRTNWHTQPPPKPGHYALHLSVDWSLDAWNGIPRGWHVIGARFNGQEWRCGDDAIRAEHVIAWHELPAAPSPAPVPASPEQDGKP